METDFNYFQIIASDLKEIQDQPKSIYLKIIEKKQGIVIISNGNSRRRKLSLEEKIPELMTKLFKKLITDHGASVVGISLMIPKKILWKKYYFPVYFRVNQVYLNNKGEGKLLVRSKKETGLYIEPSFDGSFPFSYSMVTKLFINLKEMEAGWLIHSS